MRECVLTATIAAVLFVAPALATDKDQVEWLFTHTADAIEVKDDGTLIFPAEREIFAFTDRPNRDYRYLNAHEFGELWSGGEDSFKNDPPNAVLTWVADGQVGEVEVQVLDAAAADYGRAVRYEVRPESGASIPDGASRVSLFVDGYWSPSSGKNPPGGILVPMPLE